jgi:hypothetical protein
MRSIHLAEWILALVTSRDRAASTAGDLAERAAARGAVWFWFAVLRTAASLLWRDVAEKPARPAVLAFAGLAVLVAVDYLGAALNGAAFFISAYRTGRPPQLGSIGWTIWSSAPLLTSLGIGRMLARWAPGRELAACLMYAILLSIYNLVPLPAFDGGIEVSALLCMLIVLAGAAWGRRRRLASQEIDGTTHLPA